MDKPDQNRLSDVRQTFDMSGTTANDPGRSLPEGSKTHRLKVFKSGNSLALRLPKALGLEKGMEMVLSVSPEGEYSLGRADAPKRKLDIGKFWGKAAGMVHVPEPRQDFEPRPSTLRTKP